MPPTQMTLWLPDLEDHAPTVLAAVEQLADCADVSARGAVFTRREVVDFILDLVGYTADQPLYARRILEPSFGGGDFLLPIIERLLSAWRAGRPDGCALEDLGGAVCGVELHRDTFRATYAAVVGLLRREGVAEESAEALARGWLLQGDFLLVPLEGGFDWVVGNPPYVRQELIPAALLVEYRRRYQTLYDRADLYVPFIERSLLALVRGGRLGFICADRWMKNRYGGPLRRMIAEGFHLQYFVNMDGVQAFHGEVVAYPAVVVVSREEAKGTCVVQRVVGGGGLAALAERLRGGGEGDGEGGVYERVGVTNGGEPWLLAPSEEVGLIQRLERDFCLLEEVGCRVGIGVATGADKAFIGDYDALDVEPDRKLPLVMTKDIVSGEVRWRGQGVINPFSESGQLVELSEYPRLRRYLEARRGVISGRHCAQKAPASWYRTIDKITPSLARQQKLLIPDIKGGAHVVFEGGGLYPHHNLYYITSEVWDLRALQALLRSSLVRLFIETYSTKMRGGYLRFQAQYLRRIRVPRWENVSEALRRELVEAAIQGDRHACDRAALRLYGLSEQESSLVFANREHDRA